MRTWIIGACALLAAEAAQAQSDRLALDCTGTVTIQDIDSNDPASNSERTQSRKKIFIIDEAEGRILTYSSALARYLEFCPECKKAWSATAVTWSDEHTETQYDRLSYKSSEKGRIDWVEGTAYGESSLSHYNDGDNETGRSKEHANYPQCVKIEVDTYDFASLSSLPQQEAGRAAIQKLRPRRSSPHQDLSVHPLPGGAELRYLPLSVSKNDYPLIAARAAVEGTSIVSLQVDTSGNLLGCSTARSSGSPILDQQACRLYRELGRFELRGTTQPVTVQTAVRWVLMERQ